MKIAYLVSTLKKGGPMNVLYNIIKYLDKDIEVHVITLSSESKNSRIKDFKELGCKIHELNFSRKIFFLGAKKKLEILLKRENIKLVHSHGFRSDWLLSKLRYIKSVSTVHNYPFKDYSQRYGKINGNLYGNLHLKFLKKIDKPIACSKSVSTLLKKKIELDYIVNGVDVELFHKKDILEIKKLKERLKIPQDKKIFISVGHLSQIKDPLTMIKAFKDLDYYLIILGKGPLYEECQNKSSRNPNIMFRGFVENVQEYLNVGDYFISSSTTEGMPNTVLEALATGKPVILSEIEPHNEILKYNYEVGSSFKVSDSLDLKNKIIEISKKNYENLSSSSEKLARVHFSAIKMSEHYKKVYFDLFTN